jgi:hypothetical protein
MTVRSRAFSLITAGLMLAAAGGVSAQAPAPAAPDHASSGFGAHGITAVISGVNVSSDRVADVKIQLLLKNETPKNMALAAITGETATASTSSGTQLIMRDVSGIPHCPANQPQQIAGCTNGFPADSYIEVDAGQSTGALLHFTGTAQGGSASGSISFSLRLLVRDLGDSDDALSATAGAKAAPPHLVVINFPLVPLTPGS